jgi:hypothetical protein
MSDLLRNARLARPGTSALDGVPIVTGDYLDARLWDAILRQNTAAGPKYWVEKHRIGNIDPRIFEKRLPGIQYRFLKRHLW